MTEEVKLIYDVGMHKGEDTEYYLKKGFKVVSFEADPDLSEFCRDKFSNQISSGQLTIIEGAIVDFTDGNNPASTINFYKNDNQTVWGTVVNDWADRNEQLGSSTSNIIEVATINFADCIKEHGLPYYLKIDIEGMDTVCLKALKEFEKKPAYISIESEKLDFNKLKEEFDLFVELGYHNFKAVNQALISDQKEPKPTSEGTFSNHQFKSGSTGLFGLDLDSKWIDLENALEAYKRIFRGYQSFGDKSKFRQTYVGKKITRLMNKHVGYPGWYDTHAKHESTM